ncbi:MAG TPA: hypothetical protein VMX17_10745 [Candidatus Glassbacteria bacterium]|nr:hypothetical protein [Candidatus Glassbacteria bacterium]
MKTIIRNSIGWSQSLNSNGDAVSSAVGYNHTFSQSWSSDWCDNMCWSANGGYSEELSENGMIYPGGSSCFGFDRK